MATQNFSITCHCDSKVRVSPNYALKVAFAFTALPFSIIVAKTSQGFLGKMQLKCQFPDTKEGRAGPAASVTLGCCSALALGYRDGGTPHVGAAMPPRRLPAQWLSTLPLLSGLWLRCLLSYTLYPPPRNADAWLTLTTGEKISLVLLHCHLVQQPAKRSMGSGGASHFS